MRNLLILGSGRSGTSMVAGLFRHSGAFLGDEMMRPTNANPYGYFEDATVNRVNAALVKRVLFWGCQQRLPRSLRSVAARDERAIWLAAPPLVPRRRVPAALGREMCALMERQPFCFKDPRFNVSLDLWRLYLPANTRFVVVFREPARTVDSILRDAAEMYDPPLPVGRDEATRGWWRTYHRLLSQHARLGDWLFVDAARVIDGSARSALEHFAETSLDFGQVDPSVQRSQCDWPQPQASWARRCDALYARLRQRAADDIRQWGGESEAQRSTTTRL